MSFDVLAPHYRWMEWFLAGGKLQRCRTAFLDEIPAARNILLLGEGNGRSLIECHRRFAGARITCLDASIAMLAEARARLARNAVDASRVQFVHADILHWPPAAERYDLIITNFFLDCFRAEQLAQIIPRISAFAEPDANWLVADFQLATAGAKRVRSRLILGSMYLFFRTVARLPARELTAPDSFLAAAEFSLHRRTESEWGLLHSDWWEKC